MALVSLALRQDNHILRRACCKIKHAKETRLLTSLVLSFPIPPVLIILGESSCLGVSRVYL